MGKYTYKGVDYDNYYDWVDAVDRGISGKSYEDQQKEKQSAEKQFEELTTTGKVTTPLYKAETPLLNADTTPTAPKPFTESDEYKSYISSRDNARAALNDLGNFKFSKNKEYEDAVNDYKTRDKFSYDINKDALYNQYAEKYMRQGQMAMMDTMGQAAMLTGGYGNSYAQSVGQQAYQSELQNLNDIVPQLYELAYGKYQQEGEDMLNAITLLEQERANELSDYTTNYDKLLNDVEMYDQMATNQYETDVKAWENDLSYSDLVNNAAEDTTWQYTYRGTDMDGNVKFENKTTGKEFTASKGLNPYTGTSNKDIQYGTFDNGYQPNNVDGYELVWTGMMDKNANGDERKVFMVPGMKTDSNHNNDLFVIWNDRENEYDTYKINDKALRYFKTFVESNKDDLKRIYNEGRMTPKTDKK
jgi:hypothetical protein